MWVKIAMWFFTHVVLTVAKKEADKAGVALFSESNALKVRRALITRVLAWLARIDLTKWGQKMNTDNRAAWFWQIVMKSDTIGETLDEKSIRDARNLLTDVIGIIGSVGGTGNGYLSDIRKKVSEAGTILDQKNLFTPDKK
jgi:hypothetical protein